MWEGLIQKAKDGGVDVIETYVFWNLHEPSPGKYDFDGRNDLVRFVKAIHKAGLYAHLRIGPYVCAEWNFGGFPVWLKYVPGISFRTDNDPFKRAMKGFTERIECSCLSSLNYRMCPLVCLVVTIGNSVVILTLLPIHIVWKFYSITSAKQLGPILKLFICLCLPAAIILWPILGVLASVLGGALYGFLSPIVATFDAVGEGKPSPLLHCFYDGTWSTVKRSFTVVHDFKDVCFHSYFSLIYWLVQYH
ncbi:hypothetical protein Bca52824_080877 [Brassica carinata]|uniref:beta-galactosidase n=1 Tax=Brassica carinata TaxID=52824 RepID=A0A8X7TRD9_BRACI|nr:hypothetical protein Bca52824_080877 [Brassica carinata]